MPDFRIIANSEDATARIRERFSRITVSDECGFESDTVEIVMADHDPLQPIEMPETGAELEVFLGYDGVLELMGLYVVDEIELSGWPASMTVRGKAAPFSTSTEGKTDLQTQKSRSWPKGTKLGDLVATIASEHGMEPAVSQALQTIPLPHLDQTEESDMSFLVRIGKRYDAVSKPAGGKLVMSKRGEGKSITGEDLPRIQVHARDASRYCMTLARRESPGTVIAYYHATRSAKRIEVKIGSGEPVRRLRHAYQDEEAAREAAQAEMDKRIRGEHKLTITLPGNPLFAAESPITATGFRNDVDGDWIVTRAVHNLTKGNGYLCDLECEKPNTTDAESNE